MAGIAVSHRYRPGSLTDKSVFRLGSDAMLGNIKPRWIEFFSKFHLEHEVMPGRKIRGKRRTLDRLDTTKANLQKLPPLKVNTEDNIADNLDNGLHTNMNTIRTVSQTPRGLTLNPRRLIAADLDEVAMIRNKGRKPLVVISSPSQESNVLPSAKSRSPAGSSTTAPRNPRIRSSLLHEIEQHSTYTRDSSSSNQVPSAGKQWTNITQQIKVVPPKPIRYRKKRDNQLKSKLISENISSLQKDDNTWGKPLQKPTTRARKSTRVKGKQLKLVGEEIPSSPERNSLGSQASKGSTERAEVPKEGMQKRTESIEKERCPSSVRGSAKSTPSPKPMSTKQPSREPTPMSHINMSDFADFNLSRNIKITSLNDSLPESPHKLEKVNKFKGASNRVPSGKDVKESGRKSVSQSPSARRTNSPRYSHADLGPPILVSKIEHMTSRDSLRPPVRLDSRYLAPAASIVEPPNYLHVVRGESIDSEVNQSTTSEYLPRIMFGSPPPAPSVGSHEEYTGEISIIVPKLPLLSISGPESSNGDKIKLTANCPSESEAGQSIEDEPTIRFTGCLSIKEQCDGLDSGYSSMTPRLSIDSAGQALSPFSSTGSMLLEVPGGQRSLTPNSASSSIFLDIANSRPQSSYLDARHLSPSDQNNEFMRRLSSEGRPPRKKLPAIHSRNSDYDSADENRLGFTPLPLQSVRTESDVDLSDSER